MKCLLKSLFQPEFHQIYCVCIHYFANMRRNSTLHDVLCFTLNIVDKKKFAKLVNGLILRKSSKDCNCIAQNQIHPIDLNLFFVLCPVLSSFVPVFCVHA